MRDQPVLCRRMAAIAVALVLGLATLGGTGMSAPSPTDSAVRAIGSEESRPSHDPIEILGDAELALSVTPAEDNGIRGGSGTSEDPFVISNWHISSDEKDGIYVYNTSLHLLIREVTIVQDQRRDDSTGLFISQAENVVVDNVSVRGRQHRGIALFDSRNVTVRDANIRHPTGPPEDDGFHIEESQDVVVEGANITGIYDAGFWIPSAGMVTIRDSYLDLERRRPPEDDTVVNRYYRGTGVLYAVADLRVVDNRFVAMPHVVFALGATQEADRSIAFERNHIHPSGDDLDAAVLSGERVTVRDNEGRIAYWVELPGDEGTSLVSGNELKHLIAVGPATASLAARDNTFDGRGMCRGNDVLSYPKPTLLGVRSPIVGCRQGLEATLGAINITGNTFKENPGTALYAEGDRIDIQGNAFYRNAYSENNPHTCHWIAVVQGQARSTPVQFTGNDLLRDPRTECGAGLRAFDTSEDEMGDDTPPAPVDATGNYWGPKPPIEIPYPIENVAGRDDMPDGPGLAVGTGHANITFEPYAEKPQVLSPSFVESYFSDNTGNLLPTPHPLTTLTTLLIAALATAATRRD